MTTALPMELVTAHTPCPHCAEPVLTTVGRDRRRKMLDPTPVAGGLYTLDASGVAVRRPAVDMFHELQAGTALAGGGLNSHACSRSGRAQN